MGRERIPGLGQTSPMYDSAIELAADGVGDGGEVSGGGRWGGMVAAAGAEELTAEAEAVAGGVVQEWASIAVPMV